LETIRSFGRRCGSGAGLSSAVWPSLASAIDDNSATTSGIATLDGNRDSSESAEFQAPATNVVGVVPGGSVSLPIQAYPAITELTYDGEGVLADYVSCFFADREGNPPPSEVLVERDLPEAVIPPVNEVTVPLGHHLVCQAILIMN